MTYYKAYLSVVIFWTTLILLAIAGWLVNGYKVLSAEGWELAIRVAGVLIAPLGALLGYL